MSNTAFQKISIQSGAIMLLLLLACSTSALAAPDNFVHGRPELSLPGDGNLVLSLPVSVDNEDAMGDILRDGASLALAVKITVQRKRTLWFNASEHEVEYSSLLRHDPLSREFKMSMPGNEQILQDKNLRSLLSRTWKELKLPVAPAALFTPSDNYIIKVELSLKHASLPPWLDRTLMFWTKEVVNSTSLELDYRVDDASVSR